MPNKPPPGATDDGLTPLQRYLARQRGQNQNSSNQNSSIKNSSIKNESGPRPDNLGASRFSEPQPKEAKSAEPSKTPPEIGAAISAVKDFANQFQVWLRRVLKSTSRTAPPIPARDRIVADFGGRLGAYLVDSLLLYIVCSYIRSTFFPDLNFEVEYFNGTLIPSPTVSRLLFLILAFPYYGWFYSQRGASLGKLIMKLQVVDSRSGERLSFFRGFLRETLGKFISFLVFGFGFILAALRSDHKALHDLLFETQVIRSPELGPADKSGNETETKPGFGLGDRS